MQRFYRLLLVVLAVGLAGGRACAVRAEAPVRLAVPGAMLTVRFAEGALALPRDRILDWIARSARAVAVYYGRFPLAAVDILVVPVGGKGVKHGKAFGEGGGSIRVMVGRRSDGQDLVEDWIMVHEMVHLAFPRMHDRHDWLSEGLAVYVESVARLQAGDLDPGFVWRGFVEGMAYGLPREGDKGLDFTPTWGRTYWGGAIFCLLADLEIRKRSKGARGLQDALRGVLAAGADFEAHRPIREALAAGDQATGTTALSDLYEAWRATPVDPELPALWKRLGVRVNGKSVSFDDGAALAELRKRIGQRPTE